MGRSRLLCTALKRSSSGCSHVEIELAECFLSAIAQFRCARLALLRACIWRQLIRKLAICRLASPVLSVASRSQRQIQRLLQKLLHTFGGVLRRRAFQGRLQQPFMSDPRVLRALGRLLCCLLRGAPVMALQRRVLDVLALVHVLPDPQLRPVDLSTLDARGHVVLADRVAGLLRLLRLGRGYVW